MRKFLAGLLVIVMFLIPMRVNSFSEHYSSMVALQEQISQLINTLIDFQEAIMYPDTTLQADGVVVEITTSQKKDLYDIAVLLYQEYRSLDDSLKIIAQGFEKDSL